ncbi:MAG: hypothetical protein JJE55_15095 [Flavobacteriaceae bacterium]|nr:hypothetical protein [Flavobacteriaceae bacterium]
MAFAVLNKESLKHNAVVAVSYLFVLLFLYAASSKLLDFETFTVQLAQSPLLSAYAGIIAWLVPGIEIGIALLLVFERFRLLALYAAFTLMVMFTAYIYIILNYSDFVPCSCGGVLEKLSWTQHLIFNVVFIILAGVAVLLTGWYRSKKTLFLLATLAIFGIGTVSLLFAFSEKKMHRNNAFQRRYLHNPIRNNDTLALRYNSYYFAGEAGDYLFLGNLTAPKHIMCVSKNLKDTNFIKINLPKSEIQYRYPRVRIIDSIFFLFDGTVPIIHTGNINDWVVDKTFYPLAYFTFAEPTSRNSLAIRTISSETGNNILGTILLDTVPVVQLKPDILEGDLDGYFDRDGQLFFNKQLRKMLYVYYYKNEFLVMAPDLKEIQVQNTIDTIKTPQIDVKELRSTQEIRLGGKSVRVNGLSATYGNYLFVHSNRLGRYESDEILGYAAIIDIYSIQDKAYEFSFYLYHDPKEKLLSFWVNGRKIYALIGTSLYTYDIKKSNLEFPEDDNPLRNGR